MLTSICLCTYVPDEKRLQDLIQVFNSLRENLVAPAEVIIVDDQSPLLDKVKDHFDQFVHFMSKDQPDIPVRVFINAQNMKHAASQNKSMRMADGDVLIHIEDDIVVDKKGWNQIFAKCLQDHPEVGQVLPAGSGRGEWIPRPGYNEFAWGLGGLWAVRKEIFNKIGGWDETLVHQIEPDYNIRIRMAGWRVAQIDDFPMGHLGEGDFAETFERQVQMHIGVYNFLKKWNRRFFGVYAYRDIWCMSPDDFPINVAFRRQLAAWFASQGKILEDYRDTKKMELGEEPVVVQSIQATIDAFKKCRMNENPPQFIFPTHWGKFELIKTIRPPGRERENELIEKMRDNYVFKDVPELFTQIRNLANRMKKEITDDQIRELLKGKEHEYDWKY